MVHSPHSFGVCKYGSQARLVFSRVIVSLDVHFFPLFHLLHLVRFSTLDPKWFVPANPLGHVNRAGRIHVHAQVSNEPGKSQHRVVRTVLDPDVQTLTRDSIMFECAQAYPEFNAPCEGNNG